MRFPWRVPLVWAAALIPALLLVAASVLVPQFAEWTQESLWALLQWQSQMMLLAPVLAALSAAITRHQLDSGRRLWLASTPRSPWLLWGSLVPVIAVGFSVLGVTLVAVAISTDPGLPLRDVAWALAGVVPVLMVAVVVGAIVGRCIPSWVGVPIILVVIWAWGVGVLPLPAGFWSVGGAGQSVEGKMWNVERIRSRWLAMIPWIGLALLTLSARRLGGGKRLVTGLFVLVIVWSTAWSGWFEQTHAETRPDPDARADQCRTVGDHHICVLPGNREQLPEVAPAVANVLEAMAPYRPGEGDVAREITPWERANQKEPAAGVTWFVVDRVSYSPRQVVGSLVDPITCSRPSGSQAQARSQLQAREVLRRWAVDQADIPLGPAAPDVAAWDQLDADRKREWVSEAVPASLACQQLPQIPTPASSP